MAVKQALVRSGGRTTQKLAADTLAGVVNIDVAGVAQVPGSVLLSGSASRIKADFSNATRANRVSFQTSTVDGATVVQALPDGIATNSSFTACNAADADNCSSVRLLAASSTVRVDADKAGSAPYLPLALRTSGIDAFTVEVDGSITINRAGARILGDFSNATVASRVQIQSNVANGATRVSAIPNGTGTTCDFEAYNNSNPANASAVRLTATSTDVRLESIITGSGTYLPLQLYNSGVVKVTIPTIGSIVTSADIQVNAAVGQASVHLSQAGTINGRIYAGGGAGTDVIVEAARFVGANGVLGSYLAHNNSQKLFTSTTGVDVTGNVTFTGSAAKILAPMSDATVTNNLTFQSSVNNGFTVFNIAPNGTSPIAGYNIYGSSDLVNSSYLGISSQTSDFRISVGTLGSGVLKPLRFMMGVAGVVQAISTVGDIGIGVTSPTTECKLQVSNGIKVGNTANANTDVFDWYEEGTFTPVIIGTTTAGVGTYSTQQGKYTRKGNTVTVVARLSWTAHTGTGNLQVSGLPFTSGPNPRMSLQIYANSLVVGVGKQLSNVIEASSTLISLLTIDLAGAGSASLAMDTSVTELIVCGTYFV